MSKENPYVASIGIIEYADRYRMVTDASAVGFFKIDDLADEIEFLLPYAVTKNAFMDKLDNFASKWSLTFPALAEWPRATPQQRLKTAVQRYEEIKKQLEESGVDVDALFKSQEGK
jgi:hypothetical protein